MIMKELVKRLYRVNDKKKNLETYKQIGKVHTEVSELYEAIDNNEGKGRELEEAMDVVLSVLTVMYVRGYTKEELNYALKQDLIKIEEREGIFDNDKLFDMQ